jgi:hypothetical protein
MEGTLRGTNDWFHNSPLSGLTDYGIGGVWDDVLDGVIYRWIAPDSQVVPHANGRVGTAMAPYGDAPAFLSQVAGADVNAVNRRLRSIETSDKGNADISKGGREIESLCFLTAWIHAEEAGQTADTFKWNMHHREFGVDHQQCPGAWIINHVNEIQDRTKAIMRAYQEETPLNPPLMVTYPPNWTGGLVPQPGQQGPAFTAFPAVREFTTVEGAVGRQDPIQSSPLLREFQAGETIQVDGVFSGQVIAGSDQWVRTNGAQPMAIHSSGLQEAI